MERLTADFNLSEGISAGCNGNMEVCENHTCASCPQQIAMINQLAAYERIGTVEEFMTALIQRIKIQAISKKVQIDKVHDTLNFFANRKEIKETQRKYREIRKR